MHFHGSAEPKRVMLEPSDSPPFPAWKLGPAVWRRSGRAETRSTGPFSSGLLPTLRAPHCGAVPHKELTGSERQWYEEKPPISPLVLKPPSKGGVITMLHGVPMSTLSTEEPGGLRVETAGRSGGRGGGLRPSVCLPVRLPVPQSGPHCGVSTAHSTHMWLPQSVCV